MDKNSRDHLPLRDIISSVATSCRRHRRRMERRGARDTLAKAREARKQFSEIRSYLPATVKR